ncbi:hypothetical protein ABK735_15640 [Enterobacter kobei]|uniref:hypothetical protein n=1 Tax=Enterobacter TaxID=547 RepID=UPI0006DB3AF6|nr:MULTISPECIES: hypothetical protein [Enterobacter]MBH0126409.1 hypothetical protein [Enterobacter sp. SECR18-0236]MCA1257639.1 hypothetical protein [Enterobacter kobei]OEH05735.1 hypothetical protein AN674_0226105 [Enterobacter kobei]PYZ33656.1 hypothetical protein DNK77_16195 [Enterobacter cloacae complex sp.]QMT06091.1 hypothetical protein H1R18_23110 [Enterobacter kobei]
MNNDLNESIVMLEDKLSAHNFWFEKIREVFSDRMKGLDYEREIGQLYPPFKTLLKTYPFEQHRGMRFLDLKNRWDSSDGNPIFYGYVPHMHKAVRIIQSPPEDATNQLSAWVEKSFTDFRAERTYFNAHDPSELVIYIELNNITFYYAMVLIYFWITRRAVGKDAQEVLIKHIYNTKIRGEHSLD